MRVATIVGARPQFIKAAPVSAALRDAGHSETLIHTGQHYDDMMSRVFFDELELEPPRVNLGVGSGPHGQQTGEMLIALEPVLSESEFDWVVVYGDTNSTLAGALVAAKLRLPLVHVEAGLRSFNREMPEEINRIVADRCADVLFCPTHTAVKNLAAEGIETGVHLVGDTMFDAALHYGRAAHARSRTLKDFDLEPGGYYLATIHRPYNTDDPAHLGAILQGLLSLDTTVVFPAHPRTRKKIEELDLLSSGNGYLRMVEPLGFLDMLLLEQNARMILTDSGGIQKEAYFFGVPCVTLRPETEWVETVESGWNMLLGDDRSRIPEVVYGEWRKGDRRDAFGDGRAAEKIVEVLART